MRWPSFLALVALSTTASLALVPTIRPSASADGATITAENWGEAVGFKPDLGALKVPVGTVIDKGNVDAVKGLLAPALELLVRKYGLKMKVSSYTPVTLTPAQRPRVDLAALGRRSDPSR